MPLPIGGGNFQDNGDSKPRAIKFRYFTDHPNEIVLTIAAKIEFFATDFRSLRRALHRDLLAGTYLGAT